MNGRYYSYHLLSIVYYVYTLIYQYCVKFLECSADTLSLSLPPTVCVFLFHNNCHFSFRLILVFEVLNMCFVDFVIFIYNTKFAIAKCELLSHRLSHTKEVRKKAISNTMIRSISVYFRISTRMFLVSSLGKVSFQSHVTTAI